MVDRKFIDNLKYKKKMTRRLQSQSFEEVSVLKKKNESQDKYDIYKIYHGSKTNEFFVFTSSKQKAKILRNLDKVKLCNWKSSIRTPMWGECTPNVTMIFLFNKW